jgi:uncharacterized protein
LKFSPIALNGILRATIILDQGDGDKFRGVSMSFGSFRLKLRPRVKRWLVFFLALPVIWLLASSAVAYRLTRRSHLRTDEPVPQINWGEIKAERLKTSDGEELGAWFVDRSDQAPSVLLLHGNNGNRGHTLSRARLLVSHGYAVLMVTLRAHGDSSGEYNDIGWGARQDVCAGVEFLEKRRPGRPLIVSGNSLGSAAAVFAAKKLGRRVQGYILESPYKDLKVAVWNRVDNALPPVLSHVAYAGMRTVGPLFLPHIEQISPLKAVSGIPEDVPVLILAGDSDRHARLHEAQAIVAAVASHGKLVVFPGAGHGDLFNANRNLYERTVLDFCREVSGVSRKGDSRPDHEVGDAPFYAPQALSGAGTGSCDWDSGLCGLRAARTARGGLGARRGCSLMRPIERLNVASVSPRNTNATPTVSKNTITFPM